MSAQPKLHAVTADELDPFELAEREAAQARSEEADRENKLAGLHQRAQRIEADIEAAAFGDDNTLDSLLKERLLCREAISVVGQAVVVLKARRVAAAAKVSAISRERAIVRAREAADVVTAKLLENEQTFLAALDALLPQIVEHRRLLDELAAPAKLLRDYGAIEPAPGRSIRAIVQGFNERARGRGVGQLLIELPVAPSLL